MQVKTCDVVYDDSIRCRMLDLRCRTNIRHRMAAMSYVLRHRMLRCRTCLTYDIDIRCRTSGTYDIVGVRCRTCMTYDIVCNIGIIRCRTSDVRHRTSARIQMEGPGFRRTDCGQSLLAGRPGSGRWPGLTQAGRRPPTRSRTRPDGTSSWLVSWTWCFRHLLDVSWASSVTQRRFRRLARPGSECRVWAARTVTSYYTSAQAAPPSALTPPSAGSEPGTQTCLGPYLMLMTGWDSLRAGSESSLLRGD
jgi:hypothetical protein